MLKRRVQTTKNFKAWFKALNEKEQSIVQTRISAYIDHDALLGIKSLDPGLNLFEFKWQSGMRVYFSFLKDKQGRLMLLLLGGNKNSQARDIIEAKKMTRLVERRIYEKKVQDEE